VGAGGIVGRIKRFSQVSSEIEKQLDLYEKAKEEELARQRAAEDAEDDDETMDLKARLKAEWEATLRR
jgi:Sec-independent protein translocase protein TatA